jgi:hypothetical protein
MIFLKLLQEKNKLKLICCFTTIIIVMILEIVEINQESQVD